MKKKQWGNAPRTKNGALKADWCKEFLNADAEDTVLQFPIPGTQAVVLVKLDPFNSLPGRIHDLLKTDEELEAERTAIREEAVQEYKAQQERAALPEGEVG